MPRPFRQIRMESELTNLPIADEDELSVLRKIVEGTAHETGRHFFQTLVEQLADALHTRGAFIAEFCGPERVRAVAMLWQGKWVDDFEWDLDATPCKEVLGGKLCHFPSGVSKQFPKEEGVESYLGVPLIDPESRTMGHMAVFDDKEMPADPKKLFIFRIFAARAAAELSRLHTEKMLRDSEERFRDLFDEAPIAYVHEGVDTKYISANRAALRTLGIGPEDVPHTYGRSFIPDTPDAQRRLKEAFESVGRGTDTSGVVLELRRKDNGKPIFIQWWSKPDPSGKSTRTMFVDITEHVLMEREKNRLESQNIYLQEEIKQNSNFEEIIGGSGSMKSVLDNVAQVASTDASVLVLGETGTGKELIARAIHANSPRAGKPLIKLNCAALPVGLVESELFGHERGAFSGALQRRIGRFELANGGTIFLDEIGELPLDLQAKLLRVLQEREFERVGGAEPIKVDVRIIAATNRDLRKLSAEGKFREDLYYRLNVFPVSLPPLRERREDIPLLVKFMIDRFATRIGRQITRIEEATMKQLTSYHWPGNVRELENIIERAVILCRSDKLTIDPTIFQNAPDPEQTEPVSNGMQNVERDHLLKVLRDCNWVIEGDRGAAKKLELHPNTLRSRLKKLGIEREK